ncbi:phosphoenolpyruvate--protein phosphotransferase [Coralloluteibacterium stylophorae]|uniref:Phosphoenolpyruvate-protein phosphotransferase n=1 Tax=Coralloluteibacterium stylophorae TaxID=1776034 RepID=A0A8J8AZ54_9GAMM|nr:phosphoenolpyruvate--protein phosphotransferase [Coralloluteibacterium stylophorae]MBS7456747.1 phosphoenolpyruvate--protein phosphotransferase [Coralloluteibacterium stylophorae]
MRSAFAGHGVSRGLVLGRARVREPHALEISDARIEADRVEDETARLHAAVAQARDELISVRQRLDGDYASEVGEFLDLHAMLLNDPDLLPHLDALIRDDRCSADYALRVHRDRVAAVFERMDDHYLRSRVEDLDHVIGRVHAALHESPDDAAQGLAGEILVTNLVAPAELAQLQARGVVAVVTAGGSEHSHAAILARSLHLPLIVGAHEALLRINEGDAMLVDGEAGEVVVEPDAADLRAYHKRRKALARERRALDRLRTAASRTRDGADILLYANAQSHEDVTEAHALGADGVGLYRTEFLFLGRRELPDEEEQFLAYRDLVLGMNGRPVTIRTLDLGADKADETGLVMSGEPNPALGVRGVRLSLSHPTVFGTQLRAILRASGYGPVRVLIPMVTAREEIAAVRMLLSRQAERLREEGHAFRPRLPVGAMIEVPSAALAFPGFADLLDFVSVGTNDLTQYLLATDRDNEALGDLYSPLHPAILRVLREVIAVGRRRGVEVSVCGEMAADPRYTRLLLALGLEAFSLHPNTLLEVRQVVRATDLAALRRRAPALLRGRERSAILRWLAAVNAA